MELEEEVEDFEELEETEELEEFRVELVIEGENVEEEGRTEVVLEGEFDQAIDELVIWVDTEEDVRLMRQLRDHFEHYPVLNDVIVLRRQYADQ
jgi:hypothetical protein